MKAVARTLHQFWFASEAPTMIAVMRMVVCGYVLLNMLRQDIGRLRNVSARPVSLLEHSPVLDVLSIPFPLSPQLISVFAAVMAVCGLCAAIGFCTRPTLLLFTLGYWYLGAMIGAWGYLPHSRIVPVQVMAILTVAPGTTAWSVDRLIRWLWQQRRGDSASLQATLAGAPVQRWGMQMILVLLAAVLVSAGISKVRHGGLQWMDGRTLGFYLAGGTTDNIPASGGEQTLAPNRVWEEGFSPLAGPTNPPPAVTWKDGFGIESYLFHATPTKLGRTVANYPWALIALSVATLVFELGALVIFVNVWLRNLYLLSVIAFFVGIQITMSISFLAWLPVCLCAIHWPHLLEQLRTLRHTLQLKLRGANKERSLPLA